MQTSLNRATFNEINITPLTDIFLVLLIIMMVVAPMMQSLRQDIKPPVIQGGAPVEQGKLTVEIIKDGTYFIEAQPIEPEALVSVFKDRIDSLEEKNVVIRADAQTRSAAVLAVLEAARDAGYEKVTVAGDKLSGDRQNELIDQSSSFSSIEEDG